MMSAILFLAVLLFYAATRKVLLSAGVYGGLYFGVSLIFGSRFIPALGEGASAFVGSLIIFFVFSQVFNF